MQTGNAKVAERTISTLIDLIAKPTSQGYAVVVVQTIMRKLEDKYDFAKSISLSSQSYTSSQKMLQVDATLDNVEPKKVGEYLGELISQAKSLFGGQHENFVLELRGYIGQGYILKLENMGVQLK